MCIAREGSRKVMFTGVSAARVMRAAIRPSSGIQVELLGFAV